MRAREEERVILSCEKCSLYEKYINPSGELLQGLIVQVMSHPIEKPGHTMTLYTTKGVPEPKK